jgi:hypothetical protein
MLVVPSAFSLVVVEGVPKAITRYHKLMLRRIDWSEAPRAAGAVEQEEEEEEDGARDKPTNSCHLVWEVRDCRSWSFFILRLEEDIQRTKSSYVGAHPIWGSAAVHCANLHVLHWACPCTCLPHCLTGSW